MKYDDGRGDDNDIQEDEGVLCCQGALVLLQEKLINRLRCVSANVVFTASVFVLLIHFILGDDSHT